MPIFEYVCQDCHSKYEKFVRSRLAKVELACPECGSAKASKVFSAFSTGSSSGPLGGRTANTGPACGPVG
jgi:putative FmdB family regulatory protein